MMHRVALCGLLLASGAGAADWPQFRGPDRSGVSKETGLLDKWPEKGPPLVWKTNSAGMGFSSLAIAGGKLYTLGTRGDDEVVLAFDAASSKELWSAKIGPLFTFKGNTWGDGPRGTPTIDGNHLYALGGHGDLVCVDLAAKGKEVWRKNLVKDFQGEMMSEWGYSESPLVDGDRLICTPGGPEGTLAALDKKTGNVTWRSTALKYKAPYSSITVATIHGKRQYIQNGAVKDKNDGFLFAVDAESGKTLWTAPLFEGYVYSISSSPALVVDAAVYVTYRSETTSNCHLFDIAKDFSVKDRYTKKNQNSMKNNHGGVVLVGGNIYGFSDGGNRWICQDLKSGKVLWDEANALECGSGSIIAADNRLYLYSDQGEVVLLEPSAKEWTEHGRLTIPEPSQLQKKRETGGAARLWSHPAIADGKLYLRDQEMIFCYDIRATK